MEAPIPPPLPDDEEDVSWALSTSSALWGRGERAEALKWLRRAAEHASDVNADVRALHLFKAAAEISTRLSTAPAAPSSAAPPQPSQTPPRSGSSAPPSPPLNPTPARAPVIMNATLPSAMARQLGARLEPAPPPPPPPRRMSASKPPLSPRALQPSGQGQGPVRVTLGKTMQSPGADALAVTVRREPASEEPSSLTRQTSARNAPPSRTVDAHGEAPSAAEPKPIGRRRNTADGGRKKTVDERLKRQGADYKAMDSRGRPIDAAQSRVRLAGKNERFNVDDEVTLTRSAAALAEAAAAAADALEKYDDLDEDTRVLAGRSSSADEEAGSESVEAELDRAVDDLANAPETEVDPTGEDAGSATDAGFAWSHATYDGPAERTDDRTTDPRSRSTDAAHAHDDGRGQARPVAMGAVSVAVPSTERAAPIPVLTAVRVAVLPGRAPGEARLVVLDGVGTPPAGAVHAVLMPLTSADGASILRLLGG